MSTFFIFFTIGYVGLSYLLRTVIKSLILEPYKKTKLVRFIDIFFILFYLGNILIRMNIIPKKYFQSFSNFGYIFVGISWVFILFFILKKLIPLKKQSHERREFIKKGMGLGSLAVAGGLAYSGYKESMTPVIDNVDINLPQKFKKISGFTITQISDLHIGPTLKKDFTEKIVNEVNQLESDIIVITGDIADGIPTELQEDIAPLADLYAKHGVYYVVGNHEYYWGVQSWIDAISNLGINVLIDSHKSIEINNQLICIGGVTDKTAKRMKINHTFMPKEAFNNSPDEAYKILLAHRPKVCFDAEDLGIHLQLSGHTHGGQAFPWNTVVGLVQPYLKGLYQHKDFQVYVNRGTGFWGPANRLLNQGEISKITLV